LNPNLPAPTRQLERQAVAEGATVIAGLDEVGRGSWAGPLVVGACVAGKPGGIRGVRDSKMLSERQRESLYPTLEQWVQGFGIGSVSARECDELGMSPALTLAASRALDAMADQFGLVPDALLVDGPFDFVKRPNMLTITKPKADRLSVSVAAASVLAKVSRDRVMRNMSLHFDPFEFDQNKGYPSPRHIWSLWGHGPTPEHRRSWAFMDHMPWPGLVFQRPSNAAELGQLLFP